jgi:probable O-glycosylation ligase (exosortase A-associated)
VWGPDNSFIAGNNEVALALVVVIPLIRFLYLHGGGNHLWAKRGMILWMLLCAIAALGSQSRGAMLALAAMSFMLWLKSRRKGLIGIGILIAALALVSFMPESWSNRMQTVESYQKDASAMGRISAWKMAFNAAKDRVFGTGFQNVKPEVYLIYGDAELLASSTEHMEQGPHSIYFEVLGEQGFIGLFLFLGIWFFVWRSGSRMLKEAKKHPVELGWCGDLAASCHMSMAGYGVGGAFLGLAYWDLPYNLLVLMVATQIWIKRKGWELETPPKPESMVPLANKMRRVG